MKKIKFLTLLVLTVFVSSCEDTFLSPDLLTGVDGSIYYSNDEELEKGLINVYDGIQGVNASSDTDNTLNHSIQVEFYVTEMRSGNTKSKSGEGEAAQFENFAVTPNNGIVDDYYRSFYNVVFRANLVLANLESASAAKAGKIEGEAKFLRAYAYFNLVRLFGDIPLIDKVIAPENKEATFTRVAKASVYELIVDDLKVAVENLDDTYKDRASKAAAQGLLAKVYLSLDTPNYIEAQKLCEAVMVPARGFSLISNYRDIFFSERNAEIIFAIGFVQGDSYNSQNFSSEFLNSVGRTSGENYLTDDAVAALEVLGGDRTDISYRIDPFQPTQNQNIKFLPNGETGGVDGKTFSSDPRTAGNDWIVLRYADVVLMHAEAIMAGASSTTNTNALNSLNSVRNRAGLANDADNIITLDELLDERRVELAFENQRLFDLIRTKKAIQVLGDYATANGLSFSTTDLLLPIPQREINLSKGVLKQNPGY